MADIAFGWGFNSLATFYRAFEREFGLPPIAVRAASMSTVRHEFQLTHPCPSTGVTTGRCPGYVKDYIVPRACGGRDAVSNMQWLTIRDAQAYSYCETRRSGSKHFHAELWPNNATRLTRIDWLLSAKRACVWLAGGGPPPGQSGEPTHAHLHAPENPPSS